MTFFADRSLKSLLPTTSNNKVAAAAAASVLKKKKKKNSAEMAYHSSTNPSTASALSALPPYERHSAWVTKHGIHKTSSQPSGDLIIAKIPKKRKKPPPPSMRSPPPAMRRASPPSPPQSTAACSGRRGSHHKTNTALTAATAEAESDRLQLMSRMVQDVSQALLSMRGQCTKQQVSSALHGREKFWKRNGNLSSAEFKSIWPRVQESVWKKLGIQDRLEDSPTRRRSGSFSSRTGDTTKVPSSPSSPRYKTMTPRILATAASEGSSSRHENSRSPTSVTPTKGDSARGLLVGLTKSPESPPKPSVPPTTVKRSGASGTEPPCIATCATAVSGVSRKGQMNVKANLAPTRKSSLQAKDKQRSEKIWMAESFDSSDDSDEDMEAILAAAAAFSAGNSSTTGRGVPLSQCHKSKRVSEQEAQIPSRNDCESGDGEHGRFLKKIVKDLRERFREGRIYAGKSSQETIAALQEAKAAWRSQLTDLSDTAFGTLWENVAFAMIEDDEEPGPNTIASVTGVTATKTPSVPLSQCDKSKRVPEQEAQIPSRNDCESGEGEYGRLLKKIVEDLREGFREGRIYAGKSTQETMAALQEAKAAWRSQLTDVSDTAFDTLWENVAWAMIEDDEEPAPKTIASVTGVTATKIPPAGVTVHTAEQKKKEVKRPADWSFLIVGKNYDPGRLNMQMWDTVEELPVERFNA